VRHLRLVYSAEERVTRRKRRVFPVTAKCFRCRNPFPGEEISRNDGACDPCAEILDSFPQRSEQHHDKEDGKNVERV
jgi:hypothetical protein